MISCRRLWASMVHPGTLVTVVWLVVGLLRGSMGAEDLLERAERHHCGGSCPFLGAAASLDVSIRGSGFHRSLVYHLSLQCEDQQSLASSDGGSGSISWSAGRQCAEAAAVLQPLPPAVFANVYELDNAAAVGQGPEVKLFGPVDVESIELYSQPTLLAVYGGSSSTAAAPAPPAAAQQVAQCANLTLAVQLHARYPHPAAKPQQLGSWLTAALSSVASAQLPPPRILVRCPGDVAWQVAQYTPHAAPVKWDVPAGSLQHGPWVAAGTATAVMGGMAAVLWALIKASPAAAERQQRRTKVA